MNMRWNQPSWTRILTILLVILAFCAILYITGLVLARFRQALLLFVLGAIAAYVLTPLVNRLERAFRFRWVAILFSYALVAVAIFALGLLMVTPFVQQAQSLVDNLHTPVQGSLKTIAHVQTDNNLLRADLVTLQQLASPEPSAGAANDVEQARRQVIADLTTLTGADLTDLSNGTLIATSHYVRECRPRAPAKISACPQPQTQVPPSYVTRIRQQVQQLKADWQAVNPSGKTIHAAAIKRVIDDSRRADEVIGNLKHAVSTTPILILRSQTWLDQHGIKIDLPSKLGQASRQISDQGTGILNNAITILSETVGILLNTVLILIIAFYLLLDGGRLLHGGLALVPHNYREQVWFFVTSTDKVMGGYIRGQLFLSAFAGLLAGGGAAVLGVPYPLLIGVITFLLQTVPVIGPIVAVVPAVIISLFFMPLWTTVELFVWFLVFQQIVTNILGPRVMGMAVGIHPLEALLAVLIGYPLGGLLGAFLAVPLMGILHILIREAYAYFVLGQEMPSSPVPKPEPEQPVVALAKPLGGPGQSDSTARESAG
jgi:predicted PurR-regulated permease PerM